MIHADFSKQDTLTDIPASDKEASPPTIPAKIGPYTVESLLDKGGMSLIYLGLHPQTHEPLIIKVLSPNFLTHPEMINRFIREAEIITLTNHPNIVKLYGQGKWEGGLYIAMEFIRGLSLRQLILQNFLTVRRSIDIVLQISYALFHLHSHGVVHRDLKPENILLNELGVVKVIDFGIAQLIEEGHLANLQEKVAGTPVYMSPEQRKDPKNISYSSDIYSLAIITYELVLGKLSHGDIHLSLMPRGLQSILQRALQQDPNDRYVDIMDFIKDLSAYMSSDKFDKEIGRSDYTSELLEELKIAQKQFLPSPPIWPKLEIGLASSASLALLPIYYDFIELGNGNLTFLFLESLSKGALGLLYTASIKGMIASLKADLKDPVKFMSALNNILVDNKDSMIFSMNLITLMPAKNQLHYICSGNNSIWYMQAGSNKLRKLSSTNSELGKTKKTEFVEVVSSWHVGDKIILNNLYTEKYNTSDDDFIEKALSETLFLSPQKQAENMLRKLLPLSKKTLEILPQVILTLLRKA